MILFNEQELTAQHPPSWPRLPWSESITQEMCAPKLTGKFVSSSERWWQLADGTVDVIAGLKNDACSS